MFSLCSTAVVQSILLLAPVSSSNALDPQVGKVIAAGNGKITISTEQGRQATYSVAVDAVVMLNGKPAKLEKLTMGDEAKLTIDIKNAQQLVTAVDAQSASDKVGEGSSLDATAQRVGSGESRPAR